MNGTTISSSVIVSKALGYAPEGVVAKADGVCCFCGLHIAQGDLCSPFSVSPDFMDDLSLAARGSEMTCGYCAPLLGKDGLRSSGYGVFTKNTFSPFCKWGDIAAALTNPPCDEPFVMLYATAQSQHMAWRAPVNFSRELFYVRVGLRDLKIRHAILMKAIEVCQIVGAAFGREPTFNKSGEIKSFAHPFCMLSADLKEVEHAALCVYRKPSGVEKEAHEEKLKTYQNEIQFLQGLTLGETWALRFLLTPGAGTD